MLSEDQIRFISSLVISIPLSYSLRFISSVAIKHLYSFILGTLLQVYVFGTEIWMVFMLHLLMYGIMWSLRRKCGGLVTILSLLILSMFHIYRMIIDYGGWQIDLSTVLMTMTCKYSLLAYAIEDGQGEKKSLTTEQQTNKQIKLPTILEYFSYCQFLPTAVMGTALEYQHFKNYMEANKEYKNIPAPWKHIWADFFDSLLLVSVYVLHILVFPLAEMKSEEYSLKGFTYVMIFSFFCVTTLRFKYYFAWKFSMCAVHASGISYQVVADGSTNWKAVQTCNPWVVESTKHLRMKIANWNMSCQDWLRKCIYQRSPFKNKTYSQLLTFTVSAFWHGFYAGYYLSFFLWFVEVYLSGLIHNQVKKQTSILVKLYKKTGVFGNIFTWILANYTFTTNGTFFQVLSSGQCMRILFAMYFIPPLIVFMGIAAVMMFKGKRKKVKKSAEDDEQTKLTDSSVGSNKQ